MEWFTFENINNFILGSLRIKFMKHAVSKCSCTFLWFIWFCFPWRINRTGHWTSNIFVPLGYLSTKPVPWFSSLCNHSNTHASQKDRVGQRQKLTAGSREHVQLLPLADLLGVCKWKIFIELYCLLVVHHGLFGEESFLF